MRITIRCDSCKHEAPASEFPISDGAWYCPRCGHDESALIVERQICVAHAAHALDAANLALWTEGLLEGDRPIGEQVRFAAVIALDGGRYEVRINPAEVPDGAEVFDIEQMLAW